MKARPAAATRRGGGAACAGPEIPTIAEQGLPNYPVEGWFAVIGPAKMAPADVKRVQDAFAAACASPEVKEAMTKQGNTINPISPDASAKFFKSEAARYAVLVKKANVTLE